jgi:hypothetical protein
MFRIKDSSDVQNTPGQFAMAFNVSSHAINDMRHRHACVGMIGVVIDDGRCVDGPVHREREQSLVPMNMTNGEKGVRTSKKV